MCAIVSWAGATACLLWAAAPGAAAATPLADAVQAMDLPAVRALMAGSADVNAAQVDGMTALHWAALHNDLDLASGLLAAGARADAANRYGVTPLTLACTNGNGELVELLLDSGADPNTKLPGGDGIDDGIPDRKDRTRQGPASPRRGPEGDCEWNGPAGGAGGERLPAAHD